METCEELRAQLAAAKSECIRLREENMRLRYALSIKPAKDDIDDLPLVEVESEITMRSSEKLKIALFSRLFRGRQDVYPLRWESSTGKSGYSPACANEWDRRLCEKLKKKASRKKCAECANKDYLPITGQIIRDHLAGKCTIGVYPLLKDDSCWFLASDFDKKTWKDDVTAFLATCDELQVPATLERSRSGEGGHIWIFFVEALPAELARKLGSALVTLTMEKRYGIGLDSYDRFFPNQDTLPKSGFGNLIALPLQGRSRKQGNTVFVNRDFMPYEDQWAYLSSLNKMSREQVDQIVLDAAKKDLVIGVRESSTDEYSLDDPWTLPPSKEIPDKPVRDPLPNEILITRSNLTYIQKKDLPDSIQNQLIRLAAFQNPEFYKAQKMRLPVFGKLRIISCAEDFEKYIALPRSSFEEAEELLKKAGIKTIVFEQRFEGKAIQTSFTGNLTQKQKEAANRSISHDIGILCAATAFGKTVVASWIIATRSVNTLILVHRAQLADQWRKQLLEFLDIPDSAIGTIGGGKKNPTGIIDVGLFQSLYNKNTHQVNDIVADYGQVIVDECHRVAAFSFEQVLKQAKAKFVLGLTATLIRKDGRHPIIIMQCGPARYRSRPKKEAKYRPFDHLIMPRYTDFEVDTDAEYLAFHQIYALLADNSQRDEIIINDVVAACENGRSPLLITERVCHLENLAARLEERVQNVIVLKGGTSRKKRQEINAKLESIPEAEERVIIATGRYIGEGFDDSRLDTLFLAMPISWKGTLQQYAGRLHRIHENKKQVIIYDYVDKNVPVLMSMFSKRKKGYSAIGYNIAELA